MHRSFRQAVALEEMTFTVDRGQLLCLVGEKGAGKTTILRLLATLVRPDRGTVAINGVDVTKEPSGARRLVGYVPERFGTRSRLTIGEHMRLYAGIHRLPRRRRPAVITDLLEVVGLEGRCGERVAALAPAERVRLDLARSLLHDPQVLLLDEIVSGLEAEEATGLLALVGEISATGKTVVLSSETKEVVTAPEALPDGALVALLRRGRLVTSGVTEHRGTESLTGVGPV